MENKNTSRVVIGVLVVLVLLLGGYIAAVSYTHLTLPTKA